MARRFMEKADAMKRHAKVIQTILTEGRDLTQDDGEAETEPFPTTAGSRSAIGAGGGGSPPPNQKEDQRKGDAGVP